jgi:bifunctional UDP-N-acetylglucosamine pyrophosphorylase/glucosamine-1-phosphate N-acetyltransferase
MPDPFDLIAGQPVLQYAIDTAQNLEPSVLVVAIPDGAPLHQRADKGPEYVSIADGLTTSQALAQVQPAIAGKADTVLVLTWDTPFVSVNTLREMVHHHLKQGATMTLIDTSPGDQSPSVGPVAFRDDWLWPHLTSYIASARGECPLSGLAQIAREDAQAVTTLSLFDPLEALTLSTPIRLAQARGEIQRRINERWMNAGVSLVHPEATYLDAGIEIGVGTVIWPNTFVQGESRIGNDCVLGPNSVIRDSRIGDRCRVEMSVVESATMEEGSDVGPFGHLRKGAHLGPGAHMGNFGEIKNSYLGPGAKMGHFSYLGDATVGAEANIGAGTITCNYDGQRKHATIIGERAFVGSGSMLVAPVEIGEDARTGAGSVVTHDVPPGRTAYGVPARTKPISESEEQEAD